LTQVVTDKGQSVSYAYDAVGRRISKSVDGTTTNFVWDGDCLLGELSSEGNLTHQYIFWPDSFRPLADIGETRLYFVNHPNGAPHAAIDERGKIRWLCEYDPGGQRQPSLVDDCNVTLGFQGQMVDEETGLHYNRHRYYDPAVQAFISADPLGLNAGVDLYAFGPNVWVWVDPLGLSCDKDIALGLDPYFKWLADKVQAVPWTKWGEEGVTRRTVNRRFGRAFHQAAKRARRIHFALDGIPDSEIADRIKRGRAGFVQENMTNAELHHIVTNPHLLAKTTFYRGREPLSSLPDFGV
jgi:RHS repeat-associated protein